MRDPLSSRWQTTSLRTKITAVTVLLVTLGLLVAGIGTMTVLRTYLLTEVDDRLTQAAQSLNPFTSTCATRGPNDYFIAVLDTKSDLICRNTDEGSPPRLAAMSVENLGTSEKGETFTLWDASRTTQWRVVALRGYESSTGRPVALVVGLDLYATNAIITQYATIFLGFGLSVIVLGAFLTRVLVTTTFAPLREVEATAAAIANGNFSERLSGATPNTEVGRLNQSLNTMLARIDRAFGDRAKTIDQMRRFVGDASHELRTPLVSVRGYAELYRMGALTTPEDVAQAMQRIEKEAIRMGELVEDLLELARIDEAKPLQLGPVDLVPIAYDAALDAMAQAPDRTVEVVFVESDDEDGDEDAEHPSTSAPDGPEPEDAASPTAGPVARSFGFSRAQLARLRLGRARIDAVEQPDAQLPARAMLETPAIVLAEENKIRQVVTNLLGNAMRFTNPGSPIEIGVGVDPLRRVAIIDVIDHGEGVPPQIREKIFQRFWRADTSRTRETGGSGLGLAIVSGIVDAHQGTVEVLQTEGGGATFRVILPLLPRNWTPKVSAIPA